MKKLLLSLLIWLLSCISFSSAISFGVSNYFSVSNLAYYQFIPQNDLQDNSITDWFICFEIYWKFNNLGINDSNWNNIAYLNWQEMQNSWSPICFFLSDFSQTYNLMIQSNYNISSQYFYMYALQTPPTPQVSCYTWVMNIKLFNWNTNTENNLYYEFSPYSPYNAVYSIYFTWVNTTTMQNWVLFEWNDCSLVQSDLYTCIDNYTICDWNLRSCQSDYSSCSSSLSSCQSDLNSASGYVSNLEWELSQCTQDLINCSNSSSWSGDCWSWNVQWSALYVNDIQHLGKPNIFINIPDVIDWDYISTGDDFTLNVSGYAVDTEYIEWVIAVNSYQPTSEDFTNIFVSGLTLVFPYIVIVLFIVFIRKLIKKIFK